MANPVSRNRVLVVDDEPSVAQLLAEVVQTAGFTAEVAESAAEAMSKLFHCASETCLVISDIVMEGTDGIEFARWVSTEYPTLPVVLVSGHFENRDQINHLPPTVEFRRKPISVHEIRDIVQASCGLE